MKSTYKVSGMTCQHCVNHVTEEVSEIPGVTNVKVTLEGGLLEFESEQPIAKEAVAEAVSEAGDYQLSK